MEINNRKTLKPGFFLLLFLFLFSCQPLAEKPAGLLSEQKMAEVIAELSLNEQEIIFSSEASIEAGTRYIFQKNQIKPADFIDSYKYYTINRKMEGILTESQDILLRKQPEAAKMIEEQKKKNENTELTQ